MTATQAAPSVDSPNPPRSGLRGLVMRPFDKASGKYASFPLVVLFFNYFFDEFDTAAFGTLAPEIKESFGLTDNAFGFIVILNISAILLLGVIVGYYGDRLPRIKIVVAASIVSGLFSFGTGVAVGVAMLVAIRIGNGVGVLVNDPIHRSLLTDYYGPAERPATFALHANAQRVGAIFGPLLAGAIGALVGWRAAFMILIVPIVITGFIALRLREPIRGETDDAEAALVAAADSKMPFGRSARMLFTVKTLRRQYISWLFIGAGFLPLAFLLPLYYEREFNLGPFERGLIGSVSALAALVGVQLAGKWTTQWLAIDLGEPLKRAGLTLVCVGPGLIFLALAPTLWLAIPIGLVTQFIGGMFTPAFLTTQALVSPARVRSLSFSFGAVFIVAGVWFLWLNPIFGFASISDDHGIRWAIAALCGFWVVGGLVLRSGHATVADDMQRAMDVLHTSAELQKQRASGEINDILVIRGLDVSYGPVQVLFGVDFTLQQGETVALLGTNGAGKSTLLRAISGLIPAQRGAIYFDGEDVTGLEPEDSFERGLVQVPGGRGVFGGMSVQENLDIAAWATKQDPAEIKRAVAEVLETFPSLAKRLDQPAGVLSGGEQQMLTLGMAFIAKPRLLMIDELSLGLAPIVVEDLLRIVRRIRESGTSIILVEQSVNVALTVAERAVFMEKGEVRFSGPTKDLLERDDVLRAVFLTGAATMGDDMLGDKS